MASKVLVSCVTFGLTDFTKLTIKSIRETTKHQIDFFVVVGKPDDKETIFWLAEEGIPYKVHEQNMGFPYSVNDIYDYAWNEHDYDYLILTGNDVVAYPYCIDSLINLADTTDYQVISALQVDVRSFVTLFPETADLFGPDYRVTDFSHECWNKFNDYSPIPEIADMQLFDIQNCCLYKRGAFEVLGYTDVNFYPAYYIDNDYARRIVNAGIRCCSMANARFFHFWSRTIKQGSGGSNSHYFENNRRYYIAKWGGDFGKETHDAPIKIDNRNEEQNIIRYWRLH